MVISGGAGAGCWALAEAVIRSKVARRWNLMVAFRWQWMIITDCGEISGRFSVGFASRTGSQSEPYQRRFAERSLHSYNPGMTVKLPVASSQVQGIPHAADYA